jgi:hypothetical protein
MTTDNLPTQVRHASDDSATFQRYFNDNSATRRNRISLARARDNGIWDKDKIRHARTLYDGIDALYLLEELFVRYSVAFARTPVNERCVFCNAVYLGETKVQLKVQGYAVNNHVWLVDFLRANNRDFSVPVDGLLMIWSKKWRNAGLGDSQTTLAGLCAVTADGRRNIIATECNLEVRI